MKKSPRSGEEDLLRGSSHVRRSLISRAVAVLAPHLDMWNSLKERAKRWLSSVHPALPPTRPTALSSFLQQVLQVLRTESCMLGCDRSVTHWGCVHFPRSTQQPCPRSREQTETLPLLLWWADSAYCYYPASLGWVDTLYDALGLHSPPGSQAGGCVGATLCQGVGGPWREAYLLSAWPPSVQGWGPQSQDETTSRCYTWFPACLHIRWITSHSRIQKTAQQTEPRIRSNRTEISKSLSRMSSSCKSFFQLQPFTIGVCLSKSVTFVLLHHTHWLWVAFCALRKQSAQIEGISGTCWSPSTWGGLSCHPTPSWVMLFSTGTFPSTETPNTAERPHRTKNQSNPLPNSCPYRFVLPASTGFFPGLITTVDTVCLSS